MKEHLKTVVALGTFDGVHLGHQIIIQKLLQESLQKNLKPVIVTFFPHPSHVLNPDNPLKLINSIEERVKHLKDLGVSSVYVQEFTQEFANLTALEFVENTLVKDLNMHTLIVGHDHSFGKNKEGTFEFLQDLSKKHHFNLIKVEPFVKDNVVISSSIIRNLIIEGKFDLVNEYLGYDFCLFGKVVQGNQLGRKIGYNTANIVLDYSNKIIPKTGVYVVKTHVEHQSHYGMMNIGNRPTVDGKTQTIEVHLFNFNQDLYFQKMKIQVLHRLRDEFKFESIDILKNQLDVDKKTALQWITDHKS